MFKKLLVLASTSDEVTPDIAGQIWVNMHYLIFPAAASKNGKLFKQFNFDILTKISIDEWASSISSFSGIDLEDLSDYDELTSGHVAALVGIHYCFMGRHMNAANYATWCSRRLSAFANSLGCPPSLEAYVSLQPGQSYCSSVYEFLSSKKRLRRAFFEDIYSARNAEDKEQWSTTIKTALSYLQGTEMAMFLLIHKYILTENPILLAWNELAKHSGALISAYEKWAALGDKAPYCKLICHESEVTEFNRKNLSLFCDIAVAIARKDGVNSLSQYRGASSGSTTSQVVTQALSIVNVYGHAVTHSSKQVADTILSDGLNQNMIDQLTTGVSTATGPPVPARAPP